MTDCGACKSAGGNQPASGGVLPTSPLSKVFMGQWLSNKTNFGVTSTLSSSIRVRGNYVRLQSLMITLAATAGTPTVQFTIEATADGGTWDSIGSGTSQTETGPFSDTASTLGYALLRVRAEVSAGTNTKAFFNSALVFSRSGA